MREEHIPNSYIALGHLVNMYFPCDVIYSAEVLDGIEEAPPPNSSNVEIKMLRIPCVSKYKIEELYNEHGTSINRVSLLWSKRVDSTESNLVRLYLGGSQTTQLWTELDGHNKGNNKYIMLIDAPYKLEELRLAIECQSNDDSH